MNKPKLSIQSLFIILFLFLISTILAVMIYVVHNSNKDVIFDSSEIVFEKTSNAFAEKLDILDQRVTDALESILTLSKNELSFNRANLPHLLHSLEIVLIQNPFLYAIDIGYENGNFVGFFNLEALPQSKAILNAPKEAKWMLTHNLENKISIKEFLDKKLNIIERSEKKSEYNLFEKEWYKNAIKQRGQITRGTSFEATTIKKQSIAYSKATENIVVSVHIVLDTLEQFLNNQKPTKNSAIYLLRDNQILIAINDSPFLKSIIQNELLTNINKAKRYEQNGYLVFSKPLNEISNSKLILIAPINELIAPIIENAKETIIAVLITILLLIPILILIAMRLSKSIKLLALESQKVKEFKLNEITQIKSPIYEIDELSNTLYLAASEIKEYAKKVKEEQLKLQKLIETGIALSAEKDEDKLFEMILLGAKEFTNADGGTLYIKNEDELCFEIILNDTLKVKMGGTSGNKPSFPPVKLKDPQTGEPNLKNVASVCAITKKTIVIDDAYSNKEYDFSGTKKFDELNHYHSKSFCTIPLKPRGHEVIGVIQLINSRDKDGNAVAFDRNIIPFVEALAAQAAVALENQQLLRAQKNLLDALIKLIAGAIDAKSPYTGGHCERVPILAEMLAKAASESDEGELKEFKLTTEDEWRELKIGAWLHDCGKVTTPEYVVDKATKLETIYNRIHEIRMRFEVLLRDAKIEYLEKLLNGGNKEELLAELQAKEAKIKDDFAFVANANVGSEFMKKEDIERIKEIAKIKWLRYLDNRLGLSHIELDRLPKEKEELPVQEELLADKPWHIIPRDPKELEKYKDFNFKIDIPQNLYNFGEIYNLCIDRGTLTPEERFKINEHVIQTIIMLEKLPLPRELKRVPEYAGTHHETLIGTGYPRKLTKDELSIPARIMAIADIFEALTASDRPYKKAKKLSEAIKILSFMKKDGHIDGELFELFLKSGIYMEYAKKFLKPDQIDEVDISQYLGKK